MDTQFGKQYVDTLTGIKGTCTAKASYMSGTHSSQLERVVKGKRAEDWFDNERLEEIEGGAEYVGPGKGDKIDPETPAE